MWHWKGGAKGVERADWKSAGFHLTPSLLCCAALCSGFCFILSGLGLGLLWNLLGLATTLDMGKGEASKTTLSLEQWEQKLSHISVHKEDMNKLIMNFLVTEGYIEAAKAFESECSTSPSVDLSTIKDRMEVRKAVQSGNVDAAIEKVNDLNPEILETQKELFFHLQQQRLIELIRNGETEAALEFAEEYLAPQGEENPKFLEELERTVALLAFQDAKSSPVGDLMALAQRQKTASELNAAILESQCLEKESRLPMLIKMLMWAQSQLEEKCNYPRLTDLVTGQCQLADHKAE